MSLQPKYSNLPQAIGTSLPVVTSLLAAISAALLAIPLTATEPGRCVRFAAWTTQQAGIVLGSLAVMLFVAATLAMVYAHALGGGTLSGNALRVYQLGAFFWINGISALALTLGSISFNVVQWELPALACISILASLLNVFAIPGEGWSPSIIIIFVISLVVMLASAYIVWTTLGPHAYC